MNDNRNNKQYFNLKQPLILPQPSSSIDLKPRTENDWCWSGLLLGCSVESTRLDHSELDHIILGQIKLAENKLDIVS